MNGDNKNSCLQRVKKKIVRPHLKEMGKLSKMQSVILQKSYFHRRICRHLVIPHHSCLFVSDNVLEIAQKSPLKMNAYYFEFMIEKLQNNSLILKKQILFVSAFMHYPFNSNKS